MQVETPYQFPFGATVKLVQQENRTPKQVFVLGVYASAVHATWVDNAGQVRVAALAVASEPYIFWRGDDAEKLITTIRVPSELGTLRPAAIHLNGPSGHALDNLFLEPLGLRREDAWLCDLVPHSCLNPKQKAAIERAYTPLIASHNLPAVTVPPVPRQLANEARRKKILAEIKESQAEVVILLGDEPVRWFLNAFDGRWKTLSDFGADVNSYGQLHKTTLDGYECQVLPLVHPRQAGRLGAHSSTWYELHAHWTDHTAHHFGL